MAVCNVWNDDGEAGACDSFNKDVGIYYTEWTIIDGINLEGLP